MNKFLSPIILSMGLIAAGPASATVLLDDFNRPDGALGNNWIDRAPGARIVDGMAAGTDGYQSVSIFKGAMANELSFDIHFNRPGGEFAAGIFGFTSGDNYFIDIISNLDPDGFDTYGFYVGYNASGYFGTLTTPFTDGHVDISVAGSVATLVITPTVGALQTYIHDYDGYVPGDRSVGIGLYNAARIDNVAIGPAAVAALPEPVTWALMLCGFALIGGVLRRRWLPGSVLASVSQRGGNEVEAIVWEGDRSPS